MIFVFFAATALALAAMGIFGVMSYLVVQRTREIGIRMALGAQPAAVLKMIVGQSLRVAIVGLVLGTAVAVGLTRFLASLLFEVAPLDSLTFVLVPLLLCAVAMAAAWLPARRASAVQPMVALRHE